jgi:hypothetical protein
MQAQFTNRIDNSGVSLNISEIERDGETYELRGVTRKPALLSIIEYAHVALSVSDNNGETVLSGDFGVTDIQFPQTTSDDHIRSQNRLVCITLTPETIEEQCSELTEENFIR